MKANIEYDNRQIIPRWLLSDFSFKLGFSVGAKSLPEYPVDEVEFSKFIYRWTKDKNTVHAIELVASSFIHGNYDHPEVGNAFSYLNNQIKHLNPIVINMLSLILSKEQENNWKNRNLKLSEPSIFKNIATLKKRLWFYPKNALDWLDLAYFYTLTGNITKAERCVRFSIGLNNHNPYILRSAARFFLHSQDPKQGLYYIRKSPSLLHDPWLLSAEIAISEAYGSKSKNIKPARRIAKDNNFKEFAVGEINGTLATLEFGSGRRKKARDYFAASLREPDENVIAQADYLAKKFDNRLSTKGMTVPMAYEAESYRAFFSGDYEAALTHALMWKDYQPFSARPVILASFLYAVIFSDHNKSIELIESIINITSPSPLLINNLAFSYANTGGLVEADKHLNSIETSDMKEIEKATFLATKGFIMFRKNEPEEARRLYNTAIRVFKSKKDFIGVSRALYFYGIEEMKYNTETGIRYLKESRDIADKYKFKDMIFILNKLKY